MYEWNCKWNRIKISNTKQTNNSCYNKSAHQYQWAIATELTDTYKLQSVGKHLKKSVAGKESAYGRLKKKMRLLEGALKDGSNTRPQTQKLQQALRYARMDGGRVRQKTFRTVPTRLCTNG